MSDSGDKLPTIADPKNTPGWLAKFSKGTIANVNKLRRFVFGEGYYYFDKLSEKKSLNKAREVLSVGAAEHLVSQFGTDNPLAERALNRELARITHEQNNLENVTRAALERRSQSKFL